MRDAADPSPVADDDDVLFVAEVSAPAVPDDVLLVTEVSAPAVNDAAPPAPRAFAADAAGSSPLSVAPLSELAAVAHRSTRCSTPARSAAPQAYARITGSILVQAVWPTVLSWGP